jgi:hypothetical protein
VPLTQLDHLLLDRVVGSRRTALRPTRAIRQRIEPIVDAAALGSLDPLVACLAADPEPPTQQSDVPTLTVTGQRQSHKLPSNVHD